MQPLFWAVATKLDHTVTPGPLVDHDLPFSRDNIELQYLWDPYLNRSELLDSLQAIHDDSRMAPVLIVVGTGMSHGGSMTTYEYARAIENVADAARLSREGGRHTNVNGAMESLLLFAPIQYPTSEEAPASAAMNDHLKERSQQIGFDVLWSFAEMANDHEDKFQSDGLGVNRNVWFRMADVVLGLRCNAGAAKFRSFPNIRTCCGTWREPNWFQSTFLILGVLVLPAVVVVDLLRPTLGPNSRKITRAACVFTAVIVLHYAADRTHIFEQVERLNLHVPNLKCMLVFIMFTGLLSIRRSARKPGPDREKANLPFLPRDQSEEMKGWMQLLIIIYHYNMAWTADWFWEIIRLAVAAYLFLTGFGHTVYFLQKQDYSARRVIAVLLRTNLLPSSLAYIMRTRWQLYYYMPLSTWWFLVVYATLAIGSDLNKHKSFLIGKVVVSAALVHAFIGTRDLPETVVRFFTITCKMSFNAGEFFHHRVKIDQYIVYVGMVVAIFYLWARDALSGQSTIRFQKTFRRCFGWLNILTVAFSLFALVGFWIYLNKRVHSQSEFTALQPYASCIPILAFLVLRNAHPVLRNFHSAAFAWLGRYSGEMYVMQDHLWLAGDQEAVLRTGLFHGDETVANDRWRDLALLTPLYLIACASIGEATATLTTWFVSNAEHSAQTKRSAPVSTQNDVEMRLLVDHPSEDEESGMEKANPRDSLWETVASWTWPDNVHYRFWMVLATMWLLNLVRLTTTPLFTIFQ